MAKGFCVCHRTTTDPAYLPAAGAMWHYLCDKPVLMAECGHPVASVCECGSFDDPPEYEPDDGEAQRIAEVPADARAEQARGL